MPVSETLLLQIPSWLWLLCALAVPLLIHLLRQSNPQEITFAAVHWLQQRRQRRWKQWFVRDKLLLLLRLLLLTLLVLALAQPLLLRNTQPSAQRLLVDPEVTPAYLQQFLADHPQIREGYWLQPSPQPVTESRPAARDLWLTLSQLADASEFRRAHILLARENNASGHDSFRYSPHWQWHAANSGNGADTPALPRIAVLGGEPAWLQPLIQQLAGSTLPQLVLQRLPADATPVVGDIDWLIYDTPGPLPQRIAEFLRAGGLLISDARVTADSTFRFIDIDAQTGLETAPVGRGSWLRYRRDWHSAAFSHDANLPQRLWQQWSTQDWQWQHASRGRWSMDALPGTELADEQVIHSQRQPLQQALIFAFALLLLLERSLALWRRPATTGGDKR
ncbi:BatA domain-containing protein [Microbulbifer pacificus]|uniref:BatA domain-containing protein n=1 Tax=Microbulbifer pacificus TaxID=407164 RepID=A0AAU0MTI5_9GAMM|nr:BatA domain-containing protein [Microbulbifer pacificus]WOX03906.1 BatA domain-containing protein [Microbulbifer pacificus]